MHRFTKNSVAVYASVVLRVERCNGTSLQMGNPAVIRPTYLTGPRTDCIPYFLEQKRAIIIHARSGIDAKTLILFTYLFSDMYFA